MHITLSKLLENTARHLLFNVYGPEFEKSYPTKAMQHKAVKQQITMIKKQMDRDPEMKRNILNQCKYGRERAIQLSILRRKFEI